MAELILRAYNSSDETAVVELWNRCGLIVPWNNPQRDIALKIEFQPELFLVGESDGKVIATIMAGYEGHRGWLNYLAVAPEYQGQGIGRRIVEEAIDRLQATGCPKINLQIRASNQDVIKFYQRLGFSVEDVISMGKRL